MSETHAKSRHTIDFIPTIKLILVILLFMSVLLGIVHLVNKARSSRIHDTYYAETQNYIRKNTIGLANIFTSIHDTACFDYYGSCAILKKDELMNQISHDLKDFSSTVFMAKKTDGVEVIMDLSGKIVGTIDHYERPPWEPNTSDYVTLMLEGEIEKAPWADYTYVLSGKEILVPVQDSHGRTIGLIVRSTVAQ